MIRAQQFASCSTINHTVINRGTFVVRTAAELPSVGISIAGSVFLCTSDRQRRGPAGSAIALLPSFRMLDDDSLGEIHCNNRMYETWNVEC